MQVRDIRQIIESWAPTEIAWERDNIGIQIGSPEARVRSVLLALDVTDDVVEEARKKKAGVIITHHPLIFHPLKKIDPDNRVGRLIRKLHRYDISVLAAHTNLDFTAEGVNFSLAQQLGLANPQFLVKNKRIDKKVAVFVPRDHVEPVLDAMSAAGAGSIGNYESCSFQSKGIGSFRPVKGAKPAIGRVGNLEQVDEVRIEMIVPAWKLRAVIDAMRSSHPYEEVAFDVYDLANESSHYGEGVIGTLRSPMRLKQFLGHVCRMLSTPSVRYSGQPGLRIRTVAVCGGSGAELLEAAISRGADAFVTADVRYHTFHDAEGRIALIDAGHFETEQPAIGKIHQRLKSHPAVVKSRVRVMMSTSIMNPVQYYLS